MVAAKWGMYAGFRVDYKVVLPNDYNAARACPVLVALPGGPETMASVDSGLNKYWRAEAERRGYVVISPSTPENQRFIEGGDIIFPEFLDQILHDYKVRGGKLHLAGVSIGGLAAFHLAAEYPKYFFSVTGVPGYLNRKLSTPRPLKQICMFMEVGEHDTLWVERMKAQVEQFRAEGLSVNLHIHEYQQHSLALSEESIKRLFDQFDRSERGCNSQ